jgi:hypothetical protein
MVASPSEISSEETVESLERNEMAQLIAHRDEIMDMLKWNAAVMAILLEQAGGVAEVTRQELESVDLAKVNATVEYDAQRDIYVIRGVYEEDEV